MNCGTALLNGPVEFELCCQRCGTSVVIKVPRATDLYQAMYLVEWTLVPSQHGREVKAFCPECSKRSEIPDSK